MTGSRGKRPQGAAATEAAPSPGPAAESARLRSINDLVLVLYRLSTQVPAGRFQRSALGALRDVIAFEGALWWLATEDGAVHSALPFGLPAGMFEAYVVGGWQQRDPLRQLAATSPGRTIGDEDAGAAGVMSRYRAFRSGFARRFAVRSSLYTALAVASPPLLALVALWRSDGAAPFDAGEREAVQCVAPHLLEAQRLNRVACLAARRNGHPAPVVAWCDSRGALHEAGPGFVELLRREWPQCGRATLPEAALAAFDGVYSGRRVLLEAERSDGLWLLRARPQAGAGRLGENERRVAAMFAGGMNYREIARAGGVSPATVRNQLRAVYAKLDVRSKIELARRLGGAA